MSLSNWRNAKDWWKAPILQGPENDYGEYDYLINELPENTDRWEHYRHRCDGCGKEHKLNRVYTYHFHTMDGWDSMTDHECWKCYLIGKIRSKKNKIKNKIRKKYEVNQELKELKKNWKMSMGRKITRKESIKWKKILMKEDH